jgi:hypothetical protein
VLDIDSLKTVASELAKYKLRPSGSTRGQVVPSQQSTEMGTLVVT